MSAILIYCSCPDIETAEKISRQLIQQHCAACVSILPGLTSIYEWDGKIEQSNEVLLMIKSTAKRFEPIKDMILLEHPYELPEIIAVPIEHGLQDYLDWISQCTK